MNQVPRRARHPEDENFIVGFTLGTCNPGYPVMIDPTLEWNTFTGVSGYDIVSLGNGIIYVAGSSDATWGAPLNPHAEEEDVFVAKILDPLPAHDFDGDGDEDLADAIRILQVLVGTDQTLFVLEEADINGDGKIGAHELIFLFNKLAGFPSR